MGLEIIKEIYKKKSDKQESLRLRTIKDVFKALGKLQKESPFEEAYLFGSLTKPRQFTEHSDVDIALKNLEKDKLFFAVGFLSSSLDRDVNVVHIEDIRFRDKIIREGIKWKKRAEPSKR